ncbi:ArnT family glycosyltransferase [Silvibacterium acidisoli]|uniref:ArnT family glycosyltransferase n=1 Tax=Acidobacteriaceae bacterium ZG23-2 TaxID=2883246 RepID=UPI00406C1A82
MNSLRTAKRFVFPLLGLWVLLYASFSLVKPPLLDGTDSVQAEAAREMALNGNWRHATVNGMAAPWLGTPLTWMTAASFKVFGVSDRAARLPQALVVLGLLCIAFALGTRLFLTPAAGFYAALTLVSSYGVFLFGHLLVPQMLATFANVLAIYFFWRTHRRPAVWKDIAFGASCGLSLLAAGHVTALQPLMVALLLQILIRKFTRTLPIAVAAYLVFEVARPLLFVRGLHGLPPLPVGLHEPKTPLILFWAFLIVAVLPWSLFSFAALGRVKAAMVERAKLDHRCEAWLLLGIWAAVAIVSVSLSSHREPWILPALAPLALLAAGWLASDEVKPSSTGQMFAWCMLVAGLAGAAIAVYFAAHVPAPPPGSDVALLLHLHSLRSTLLFGHLNDLSVAMMGTFHVPLLIFAAALAAGVTTNLLYRSRGKARMANCFLAGMMVFCLLAAHLALHTFSPVVSSAIIAEAIKPEVEANDIVMVNGAYADASALPFYLERPVMLLRPSNAPVRADVPAIIDAGTLASMWSGDRRVFLWSSPAQLPSLPGEVYVIARAGGREIVSNQPNNGGAAF